jgi:hypothetical protein
MTFQEFASKHGLELRSERITTRPESAPDQWSKDAYHFTCTLARGERTFQTNYSMGSGHATKKRVYVGHGMGPDGESWIIKPVVPTPKIPDLLQSLALDASSVEDNATHESWCREFGYDPDSRKAESIYRRCVDDSRLLRAFLGNAAYTELLQCEEE